MFTLTRRFLTSGFLHLGRRTLRSSLYQLITAFTHRFQLVESLAY